MICTKVSNRCISVTSKNRRDDNHRKVLVTTGDTVYSLERCQFGQVELASLLAYSSKKKSLLATSCSGNRYPESGENEITNRTDEGLLTKGNNWIMAVKCICEKECKNLQS